MNRTMTVAVALAIVSMLSACGESDPVPPAVVGPVEPSASAAVVKVLSNRSDLINAGDALVEVVLPAGTAPSAVRVDANGRDVTSSFGLRADGRYYGLVSGLPLGPSVITAHLPDGTAAASVVNHPNGGPVFAGPQPQPWTCRNEQAQDAQCNQPPEYEYLYKSTDPLQGNLQPYDPASPPTDVANTTTDQGVTVPFIVRVETGYQDRDQYKIAALYQPDQPWTATAPQTQFNHKMVITHGASCGIEFQTSSAPSVTQYPDVAGLGIPVPVPIPLLGDAAQRALAAGFVVMSTALNNNGHNCSVVTQAESMVMAKERVIENYGTLRYTIGMGCSGGSLTQQWVANAYPGIYQGILPTCSFPDTWTAATQVMDYFLLRKYLEAPGRWAPGVVWTPDQMAAVEGHVLPVNAIVSEIGYFSAVIPAHACGGVSDAERYHPQNNPAGVRCSIIDLALNVFAPRPPAVWSPNEQLLGRGFGGAPVDNVGVEYGLTALQAGQILPAQFVDLNQQVGGVNIDIEPVPHRLVADQPALANAYRSGMINSANHLDQTAIIDCRGPDPAVAHDSFRAFAIRARLDREHGSHANQLIWEGPIPVFGDSQCAVNSLLAMDRWLSAVEQDRGARPLAEKLVAHRPEDLRDRCYDGLGDKLTDALCPDLIVPVYGTPRMVAGDAITTDANKCQLRPLDRAADYGVLGLNDAQWAQMQALFPEGVCDYSKPGVSQQPTIAWQTYQEADGRVIYGGRAMPAPPAHSGGGWADPAFGVFQAP